MVSEPQHWLCVAFDDSGQLIHGCLVHNAEPWVEITDEQRRFEKDLGATKLHVIQALLASDAAESFTQTLETQSIIDLSGQNGPPIPISGRRQRLLDGFGMSKHPTITYSAGTFPDLPEVAWVKAVEELNALFGGDFKKQPDRLGAFLVFGDVHVANIAAPVSFEVDRDVGADMTVHPDRFSLIPQENIDAPLHVLVELSIDGEPAYSKLFSLTSSQSQTVDAVAFDEYRISVFDKSGNLIFAEGYPLLLRIAYNLSPMGQTHSLSDSLTKSAQGLGKEVADKARKVTTRSTMRSMVGVKDVAFDIHRARSRSLMHRLAPTSAGDRWFPRGIANEIDVIRHLNTLLDGGRIESAIIVDPFFGVDTLKRVIARVESLDVKLTVVMSLTAVDPETNEAANDLIGDLARMLEDVRRSPQRSAVSGLRVVNLVDGERQAFHDRYLLLSPHEGAREVYLLSNSLNRMAGNWPFCISKLDPAAARDAARYIDGLVQGRDISGSTQPSVTFRWPNHENV